MTGWNESAWFAIFVGVALKSTAVLGAAWLGAFLMRGRSAAARGHAVDGWRSLQGTGQGTGNLASSGSVGNRRGPHADDVRNPAAGGFYALRCRRVER